MKTGNSRNILKISLQEDKVSEQVLSWPPEDQTHNCVKFIVKVSKKAEIRNRYNQVPHLNQDNTWESDKNTTKHHIKESQEVSPFLAGDFNEQVKKA